LSLSDSAMNSRMFWNFWREVKSGRREDP
jgi:hypothetical protein